MVHPPSTIKSPSRPRKLQEWSSKDKNDIYERRQSGENWKSIEKVLESSQPSHSTVLISSRTTPAGPVMLYA